MNTGTYNQLVEEYADHVFRFIFSQVKDEDSSRDIVQDTFEKLWVNRLKLQTTNYKSWLFSTSRNLMIDFFRKSKKSVSLESNPVHEGSYTPQSIDLQDILHEALSKIPEIQKSCILLRDYEGYNYSEIGEILKLSESQVKVYIFRARTFLKKYIGSPDMVI